MENGIAILKRKIKVLGLEGEKELIEHYYGEINVRYNQAHHKLLYINFLEMEPQINNSKTDVLLQNYRELYLILFWPSEKLKFDFTRGMLLGDRDIDRSNKETIINSSTCVLCSPNEYWNNVFDEQKNIMNSDNDYPISTNKINNVYEKFLRTVFHDSLSKNLDLNLQEGNVKAIDYILNCLEISFDGEKMCFYQDHF